MTADVELLPELVAEGLDYFDKSGDEGDKQYVSAIRQHIAARDAEIEALRAEVGRLRTDGASAVRWAPSSSHWSEVLRELFGPNARDGIDAMEARLREERARAERLAEALRWAERHCPCGARPESPNTHPHVPGCPIGAALHTTTAQENDDA